MKNKIMVGLFVLSLVLISGCVQNGGGGGGGIIPSDKPFIKEVKATPDYVYLNQNDKSRLDFTIYNPSKITFTGYVEVRIDVANCFSQSMLKKDVTVPAQSGMPYSIDLTPYGTNQNCLGSRQITLVLNDVSAVMSDYKTIQLNIVER